MSQGFPYQPDQPQLQAVPPAGYFRPPEYKPLAQGPMPVRMSGPAAWIPVIILALTAVNAYLTNHNAGKIDGVHQVAATAAFKADEAAEKATATAAEVRETNAEVKATRAHVKAALPAKARDPRDP